jgi:hypothetical protein
MLSRQMSLPWRVVVASAFSLAVLAMFAPIARSHDSEYCGHSTVSGNYWRLSYYDYDNDVFYYPGQGYREVHSHKDHHDFRDNPQSYFTFAHNYELLCGEQGDPSLAGGFPNYHLPTVTYDPGPPVRNWPTLQPTKKPPPINCCARSRGPFLSPVASQVIAALAPDHRVIVYRLQERVQLQGPSGLVDVRAPQPLASDCLLTLGTSSLGAIVGHLPHTVGVEVADPDIASRVGHPCG